MPYCVACRMEFQEGVTACSDCGTALTPGPMPPDPSRSAERWTSLLRVRREETAAIIQGHLESAGIECEVIDKTTSELPVPVVTTFSYVEIWVPESSAAEARRLLDEARDGTAPCKACGHMSSATEAACEYCGAAL